MKKLLLSLFLVAGFLLADAQDMGYSVTNIQFYFGDLLEQEKWDFDKEYRWGFYICADDVVKLQQTQKELFILGFTNFEIAPNSMGNDEKGAKLSMLSFEKTKQYIPQTLLKEIEMIYALEKKYHLSSFDDYGNYELKEEVLSHTGNNSTGNKTRVF